MSLQERIVLKENAIKEEINQLRLELNKLSSYSKVNPNDWRYLTALSTVETELKRINGQLKEISQ
jgi:hypothetical protein